MSVPKWSKFRGLSSLYFILACSKLKRCLSTKEQGLSREHLSWHELRSSSMIPRKWFCEPGVSAQISKPHEVKKNFLNGLTTWPLRPLILLKPKETLSPWDKPKMLSQMWIPNSNLQAIVIIPSSLLQFFFNLQTWFTLVKCASVCR